MKIISKPSPNYTRGRTQKISKIVIHWMNGTLAGTDAVFSRPSSGVSAHYGIENANVHQYVKDSDTAWHAISANPFSIGIEHSAAPGRAPSESTYKTSAQLIADICKRYKLDPRKCLRPHCYYVATRCCGANKDGKVIEKGGVDVNKLRSMAYNLMQGEDMYKGKSAKQWYKRAVELDKSRNLYRDKYQKCKSGSNDSKYVALKNKLKELIGGK